MVKIFRFLLLVLAVANCGGKTPGPLTDSCPSNQTFESNRLANSQSVDEFPNQTEIDLTSGFSETQIAVLEETFRSVLNDTQITDWTITLAIPGKGSWTKRHLTTNSDAAPDDTIFWWMSVGKMFTSTVIHQLIAERKLTLDTSIGTYFPEIKQGDLITINHLLTHTSGLYSFQEDPGFRAIKDYLSPNQLLAIALQHEPTFCPGTSWYYSNTGYLLLGLIIEKIENKTYQQVIEDRITKPLQLKKTFALNANQFPENLVSNQNSNLPGVPFSAGNIVSNSEDMVVFLQAVLTGRLFSTTLLSEAITNPYQMFESELYYGKGVMSYYSPTNKINWIGHSGGAENANALIAYDFESGAYIAISVNDATSATSIAFRFFNKIKFFTNQ